MVTLEFITEDGCALLKVTVQEPGGRKAFKVMTLDEWAEHNSPVSELTMDASH